MFFLVKENNLQYFLLFCKREELEKSFKTKKTSHKNKNIMSKLFKESPLILLRNYTMICIGLALFAFGWTAFLIPNQMMSGGVSGIAAVIHFAFNSITVALASLILNLILIATAWKFLGSKFCINTLLCSVVLSCFMGIGESIFVNPLVDDLFMSAMLGGAISAVGVGIAINYGGNTGGTDIIAMIIGKYRNISYGRVTLFANFLIIGSSFLVVHSIEKMVYSFVIMFVYIYVSDMVIDGYRQTFQFMVFSKKNHEIAEQISKDLKRGASFLRGYGSFTKEDSDVLLIIAHRNDKAQITRIIKNIDKNAFVTVTKTSNVFGKNFDTIKE